MAKKVSAAKKNPLTRAHSARIFFVYQKRITGAVMTRNVFGTSIALAIVTGLIGVLLGFATSASISAVVSLGL